MEDSSNRGANLKSLKNKKVAHKADEKIGPKKSSFKQNLASKFSQIYALLFKQKQKSSLFELIDQLVGSAQNQGFVSFEAQKMIKNIVNIDDVKVDDVMIPRTDIVAISKDADLSEIKNLIIAKEHSRIPVYNQNLDEITGFIHSKDVVKFVGSKDHKIKDLIRKILYVPHSMRITDLLLKMRSSQVHIAIVLDEYGGTDGLVTIEDIMEEIVGEIEDEHDVPDNNIYMTINKVNDHVFRFGGRVEIGKVEELLSEKIIENKEVVDFDTVGGLVLAALKKVPESGEIFKHSSGLIFKVLDADMRSVKLVEVSKDEIPDLSSES